MTISPSSPPFPPTSSTPIPSSLASSSPSTSGRTVPFSTASSPSVRLPPAVPLVPQSSLTSATLILLSIGPGASTTPRRLRPLASAKLTTLFLASWSYSSTWNASTYHSREFRDDLHACGKHIVNLVDVIKATKTIFIEEA
ncbi:hypothetical protein MLD38_021873 [Melastoma candidum]|uniref:Uncharacterized protein n=1 Tax=Melastoma candidum TaxID=119954 RepID=A0ACB9QJ96_9MYRT|nr:hypothetical protein MLD38_021873 [Melastoma candidum]